MKGSRLHFDLFRIFCDIAQTGSFSRAANRNHLTQSAVSQQLSFLERHFGRRLIDRGRGHLVLTEEGERFLKACRKMVEIYQETLAEIRGSGEISGTVKVETVYSIGLHSLDSYLKTFVKRHPKVDLQVEFSRADRIYSAVLNRDCDLGIVAYPGAHPRLSVVGFKRERMVLVCPPKDVLSSKKSIRWTDLAGRDFVAFYKDIPTGKAVGEILRRHNVSVRVVQELDNIETLKRAVEVGRGVSLLPADTVKEEMCSGTLVGIPPAGAPIYRPTGVIRRNDRNLSRAALAFVEWLGKM